MSASKKIIDSIDKSSFIRKMFEEANKRRAKYGAKNVFDFSIGNPNLEPPQGFQKILLQIASDPRPGLHGYMPNAGYVETREAVAEYLNTYNQAHFTANEIAMTVGAAGALNVVLKTLLNPGEEVIIPTPYFVEYNSYIDNFQGVSKPVRTKEDFSLDFEAISEAITEKTKVLLINSPNNPTGKIYSEEDISELGKLLSQFSDKLGQPIYLISDEPYRKIIYDGASVPSIFDAYPESFVVTSFSKDLSLPGERIGYAAVNPGVTDKETITAGMALCTRILGFVNAPAIMQRAITHLMMESVDVSFYQRKRDRLYNGLVSYGYEITKPKGTFYLFPKAPVADDVAFVDVLKEENILTVPGVAFGGPGHFRISYCVSDEVIEGALPGFARVIRKYRC